MTMQQPATFNASIAHITHGEHRFQVLNAEGNDWDEAATRDAYAAWCAANPLVLAETIVGQVL